MEAKFTQLGEGLYQVCQTQALLWTIGIHCSIALFFSALLWEIIQTVILILLTTTLNNQSQQ